MSQQIKIKDAELAELTMLRHKFEQLVIKFGTAGVEKMELDLLVNEFIENEKQLKEEWISLRKLERELLDKIASTYGDGNLNVADGTFTIAAPLTAPPAA